MLRFFVILYLLSLLFNSSFAQQAQPYYIQFNTEDGLPSAEVYDVAMDENGFPWFATDRGVCYYNGYELQTFATDKGLANNTCLTIRTDPDGKLWFIGLDGSLSHQGPNGLQPFGGNREIANTLGNNHVVSDMQWVPEREIFILFRIENTTLLTRYDLRTGTLHKENLPDSLGKRPSISVGETNYFKFGERFFPDMRSPYLIASPVDSNVIYTCDPLQNLLKIDVTNGEVLETASIGEMVNRHFFDQSGDLWVLANRGAYRFQEGDLRHPPDIFFEDVAFSNMAQDQEGNYWLTTLGRGVFLIPSFNILSLPLNPAFRRSPRVISLGVMQHHLLIGAQNGELYAIDRQLNISLVTADERNFGRLTFSSTTPNGTTLGCYSLSETESTVSFAYQAPSLGYQIGTFLAENVVFRGCPSDFYIKNLDKDTILFHRKIPRVQSTCWANSRLWIGTIKGLWAIDGHDYNSVHQVLPQHPLLQIRVNDIVSDGFGGVWIATIGNGLLHLKDSTLHQWGTAEGLSSNLVNQVFLEQPGTLWLATNQGLDRFTYSPDGEEWPFQVRNFGTQDGLPDNYLSDVVVWHDTVFLASNAGLAFFPANALPTQGTREQVSVILESIEVNQRHLPPYQVPQLLHDQNDLTFHFLGNGLRRPKAQKFYRYALTPVGQTPHTQEWIYTNQRAASYLNLAPGDYQFQVAASNQLGHWGKPTISILSIAPHFSETLVFRVFIWGIAALLLLAIMAYISWRYRQARHNRQQLQMAKLKARDAQIFALRSQMNPHFVFNSLNAIQNFIFHQDVRNASHFLSRFAKVIRDGVRFSRRKSISLKEEIDFLEAYLSLEKMRFPDRFDYQLQLNKALQASEVQIPPFLLQPLVENAVKHAFKDIPYPGVLHIRLEKVGTDWLKIEIEDNGPGFDTQKAMDRQGDTEVSGIQVVHDRVERLKMEYNCPEAKFELTRRTGQGISGTLARFLLPIQLSQPKDA